MAAFIIVLFMVKRIVTSIDGAVSNLGNVAKGALQFEMKPVLLERGDEVGDIARAIQSLIHSLREILTNITSSAKALDGFSNQFAESFANITDSVDSVNTAVEEIASGATSQADETMSANQQVAEMGQALEETSANVENLHASSEKMEEYNETAGSNLEELNAISEQTKQSVIEVQKQTDDKEFRMRRITSDMEDLGSRRALEGETNLIWYPAEVNTSIRPGWFYHPEEDDQVKSLEELIYIYIGAVGGNATFLLNIPPMPNGLLHENDVKRLEEFGSWKKKSFTHNLMSTAHIFSENEDPTHPVSDLTDDTSETWFQPESSELPVEITIRLDGSYNLGYLVLKEAVCYSQRVEKFEIFVKEGEIWNSIYTGTVIGYKKIISVKGQKAQKVKIVLHDFRVLPLLSFVGIYPESL